MKISKSSLNDIKNQIKPILKASSIVYVNDSYIAVESTTPFSSIWIYYLNPQESDKVSEKKFAVLKSAVFQDILKLGKDDIEFSISKGILNIVSGKKKISISDFEVAQKDIIVKLYSDDLHHIANASLFAAAIKEHKSNFSSLELLQSINGLFVVDGAVYSTNRLSLIKTKLNDSINIFIPDYVCNILYNDTHSSLASIDDKMVIEGKNYRLILSRYIFDLQGQMIQTLSDIVGKANDLTESINVNVHDMLECIDDQTIKGYNPEKILLKATGDKLEISFMSGSSSSAPTKFDSEIEVSSNFDNPIEISVPALEFAKLLNNIDGYDTCEIKSDLESFIAFKYGNTTFVTLVI